MRKYFFLLLLSHSFNLHSNVIYVSKSATGLNDGKNWKDAYQNLTIAIFNAAPNDSIWVASGVYIPTETTDPSIAFDFKNDIHLYGGFSGNEKLFSERNLNQNLCILSGDIGMPNDSSDNSFTVLFIHHEVLNFTLDGFIIENAYPRITDPSAPTYFKSGGALYYEGHQSDLIINFNIRNCIIRHNRTLSAGAGFYFNFYNSGLLSICNCTFMDNIAQKNGAALLIKVLSNQLNLITDISQNVFQNNISPGGISEISICAKDSFTFRQNKFESNFSSNSSDLRFDLLSNNAKINISENYFKDNFSFSNLYFNSYNFGKSEILIKHNSWHDNNSNNITISAGKNIVKISYNYFRLSEIFQFKDVGNLKNCLELSNSMVMVNHNKFEILSNSNFPSVIRNLSASLNFEYNHIIWNSTSTMPNFNLSFENRIYNNIFFIKNKSAPIFKITQNKQSNNSILNNTFYFNNFQLFEIHCEESSSLNVPVVIQNNIFAKLNLNDSLQLFKTTGGNSNVDFNIFNLDSSRVKNFEIKKIINIPNFPTSGFKYRFGNNNLFDTDPLFLDSIGHISPCSPALNKGTVALIDSLNPVFDIDGEDRIQEKNIDIGADETKFKSPDYQISIIPQCGKEFGKITLKDLDLNLIKLNWIYGYFPGIRMDSLIAGKYTLSLLFPSKCIDTINFEINSIPQIELDYINGKDIRCNGFMDGSLELILKGGTPPYRYQWNNNDTTAFIENLGPGIYTCTITDQSMCQFVVTGYKIPEPELLDTLKVEIIQPNISSMDGSIELFIVGGTPPYKFKWSNNDTFPKADSLGRGFYYCLVTDKNSCSKYLGPFLLNFVNSSNNPGILGIEIHHNLLQNLIVINSKLESYNILELNLIDINGKFISEIGFRFFENSFSLSTSHLLPGIYLLQIKNGNNLIATKKIFKL
ncbi:MAG: T9SS type A sorting domain-containing protein [Saprospiraceae bacterium]|nr:T9SS type A sorting domain-containing protein [Candidatus Vicinibacter affinis]